MRAPDRQRPDLAVVVLRRRRLAILLLAVVAGCGGTATHPQGLPGPTLQPPLSTSPIPAPPGLVSPGTLSVATDPTYPPETTEVGGTITGFDIDLAGAMASQMGLKVKVVKVFEDTIIPGFTAADRKYDMGISAQPETTGITATAHTLAYLDTGQSLIAGAADRSITGLSGVCGRQVGGVRGSTGETALLLENERGCKSRPVIVKHYDDDVTGVRDVSMGKLAAFVDDYPSAVFLERSVAGIRVVPHHFARAREVMVFPVTDATVHDAVALAFERLRKDGTYARLLHKWSLDEGAIS